MRAADGTLMSTLTTRGLIKRFGGNVVVDEVDLEVNGGEVVGLLGPNGAGKTTCFYMICGLVRRDAGSIWLDSEDISTLPMHQRARKGIGYLPQEPSIFRRLTVRENLLAVLEALPDLARVDLWHRSQGWRLWLQPFWWRAAPGRNCPSRLPAAGIHAAGRTLCWNRPDIGWRYPETHRGLARYGHRLADH